MNPSHYPLKILGDDLQKKNKIDPILRAATREAKEIYNKKLVDIVGTRANNIITRFATIKISSKPNEF